MININRVSKIKKIFITAAVLFCAIFLLASLSACAPSDYKPTLKNAQVNTPDIMQSGKLKVGVDFGNPPLAGETSKSAGIDIDVASALGDELGLQVEFVDVGSSPELSLANKKCDIVMGIPKYSEISELKKLDPYLETGCALFSKSANAQVPKKDGNDKISTQMASASALASQAQFGVSCVKLENSLNACFDQLEKGQVKYVAADAVIGTYTANQVECDCQIIALLTKPSGYCIGIPQANKNLSDKVSAALDNLKKGGVLEAIERR